MKIGHRLKTIRTAKRIEPIIVADKIGVSESTYRRYERDESEPTLSILYKIAEFFQVTISELLSDEMQIKL